MNWFAPEWMAWTRPTAIFFILIALMIIGMTIYGIKKPAIETKGFLPIPTTRGLRLYIGLLGFAVINLAWLGFTDASQWFAVVIAAAWLTLVLRWG